MNPQHSNNRKFWLSLAAATLATTLAFSLDACKANPAAAPIVAGSSDPGAADGNMAPVSGQPTQVMGQSASYTPQQSSESYSQAPAPVEQGYADNSGGPVTDANYVDQDVSTYANDAPPPLPEYDQPAAPEQDDQWTPGYWAYGDGGYYWVPGTWVAPPYYGALWTPPYWGYCATRYCFHHGYWGLHIGYYGGIDYGFGYIGFGYWGGYWRDRHFYYNGAVNNVHFNNYMYSRPVVYENRHYGMQPSVRISFNGGRGGVNYAPRPAEFAAMRENHVGPIAAQEANHNAALQNRGNAFAENHGRPAQAALARPAGFNGRPSIGEMPAAVHQEQVRSQAIQQRSAPNNAMRPAAEPNGAMRPAEPNNAMRPGAPNNAMRPAAPVENRPAPQMNRAAPAQQEAPHSNMRMSNNGPAQTAHPPMATREAPQQHVETPRPTPAPQQHMEAPRAAPAPQQHMEAPRPAPQQQHVEAPRPAPAPQQHAAPAPRAEAPHPAPAGGDDHHR